MKRVDHGVVSEELAEPEEEEEGLEEEGEGECRRP